MMRTLIFVLVCIPLALGISPAGATSVQSACSNLEKCTLATAEISGSKYLFDGNLKTVEISASPNFEFTKENAEEILSQMLDQNGFTRIPLSEPRTFTILRQRDARDSALPMYNADATTTPEFPRTWDLATLRYRTPRPHLCDHIARTMRSFLPGNSRVIPDEITGQILVTASQPILASVLEKIQAMDIDVPEFRPRKRSD